MEPYKRWKVGDIAVVDRNPQANIYRIKSIDGWDAKLEYRTIKTGEFVNGGEVDLSVLRIPTTKQLANAYLRVFV